MSYHGRSLTMLSMSRYTKASNGPSKHVPCLLCMSFVRVALQTDAVIAAPVSMPSVAPGISRLGPTVPLIHLCSFPLNLWQSEGV